MCVTAWCSGALRPSSTFYARVGGRSTRPLSSASTCRCASMWRQLAGAPPRCANTRTAYASSWPCARSIIVSACPIPVGACPCHRLYRPTARAQSSGGSPACRHSSRLDGPCLELASRPALSHTTMAVAHEGMSTPRWWEAVREAGLRRRRASAQPGVRASPGMRGRLGRHGSPLDWAFLSL